MQAVEKNAPLQDPSGAESGSRKPGAPGPTRQDKSSPEEQPPRGKWQNDNEPSDPRPELCDLSASLSPDATGPGSHAPYTVDVPIGAQGLTESVNDVPELSRRIGMDHDSHREEKVLPPSSLEGQAKDAMHNAFWDHLKEQLSATPPDFSCALELLKEIKEILLSLLLPRQSRLRSEVEEALAADLLQREAEHGDLNILRLSKCILSMMTLLCAPVRDEAVQRLDGITDSALLLRGIFQVLGLMRMDMRNYTLQSRQPHLREHSILHERAQFQERLSRQPGLLDHTTKWLSRAAADLRPVPDAPASSGAGASPSEAASGPEPLSPAVVLSQAFLNLLLWDPDHDEEFPETLLADRARLRELEVQLRRLTVLASVLLVASSSCGSVLFGSPQFVDKLKRTAHALTEEFDSRPEEAMLTVSEQVSQEIHQSLKSMGLAPLSSDNIASLMGQLRDIAHAQNCVRSVIDQRIHLFLKCCLVLGVQRSLLDLPGGLSLIEAELAELGQRFVSLTHHNQQVFGPYYTEILKTLIPLGEAPQTGVESL